MKKTLKTILFFVFAFLIAGKSNQAFAVSCSSLGINMIGSIGGPYNHNASYNMSFDLTGDIITYDQYQFHFRGEIKPIGIGTGTESATGQNGKLSFSTTNESLFLQGEWTIKMSGPGIDDFCDIGGYSVIGPDTEGIRCSGLSVYQVGRDDASSNTAKCYGGEDGGCLETNRGIWIKSKVVNVFDNSPFTHEIIQDIIDVAAGSRGHSPDGIVEKIHDPLGIGTYTIAILSDDVFSNPTICSMKFEISDKCSGKNSCEETEPEFEGPVSLGPDVFSLCSQIPENQTSQRDECLKCTEGTEDDEGNAGVWTAIGCIKRDPTAIVEKLITVGLGIGGGFALITFLTAGFIYSTSQGSPEKVKNAKEMMTASIVGILFVIFSVTMLQFVGWSVLKIPGFGG